jgi:subtilisin family serine protease/subtilisin-like proprotein convertase family protein
LKLERLEDRTLLSASGASHLLDTSAVAQPSSFDPSHILVHFRPGANVSPGSHALLKGTTLGPALGLVPGLYEINLAAVVSVTAALAAYQADPRVLTAEPDYNLSVARVPNDARFGSQWDLNNTGQNGGKPGADIRATKAWDVTTGTGHTIVALLDTGIDYNHPDLYLNIWINQAEIPRSRRRHLIDVDGDGYISFRDLNDPRNQGAFKITDVNHDGRIDAADILAPMVLDAKGHDTGRGGWAYPGNILDGDAAHPNDFIGWNFVNNTNNPFDDNNHGTHVAGTIGATGDNGIGIAGINWHATLMPVKFLDAAGQGTISGAIAALQYAVAHGARISNNSYAGGVYRQTFADAIQAARAKGHIFVAAAGNGGPDGNRDNDRSPNYPSGYRLDNVVAVAATDRNDNLAGFSSYGATTVDLAAPGVEILSTTPYNSYEVFSGTSMATPHVTGVLSLVWDLHPNWTYQQVIHQVLSTVDLLPSLRGKTITGGRLDAARAVGFGLSPAVARSGPRVLTSSAGGVTLDTFGSVRLTFNKAIDAKSFTPKQVRLTGPDGKVIHIWAVRAVPNSGDRQFDVSFGSQSAAGNYRLTVGPNVRDQTGNLMDQDGDGINGQTGRDDYVAVFTLRKPHAYSSTASAAIHASHLTTSTVFVSQALSLGDLQVRLNVAYPHDGDLFVYLRGPNGLDLLLINQRGGAGHDFRSTLLDDKAGTAIRSGRAPFAGTYKPEGSLSIFHGKNARGTWTLFVEDHSRRRAGTLLGWSLLVSGGLERAV